MPWLFDVVMESINMENNMDEKQHALKAEKLVKALILGMARPKTESVESSSCNLDEFFSEKNEIGVGKRRRKRRRRRPVITVTDFEQDHSVMLFDHSDSEDGEPVSNESHKKNNKDSDNNVSVFEESGSEISQDENYRDFVGEGFILDYEQRMVNDNLLNENESLNEVVKTLEVKLSNQFEKSATIHSSLKELRSDNRQLQRQKTRLQKTVKSHVEIIDDLKERMASLKKTCSDLTQEKEMLNSAKRSELENIQNELKSTDEQLKSAREKNKRRYEELTKSHDDLLSKITDKARGITEELSKTLGSPASKPSEETGSHEALVLLQKANRQLTTLSHQTIPLQNTVEELKANIESQTKSMSKLCSEKKSLREELFELSKQNKTLLKEKAKLQREIESLKKESVKAKNLSQSFKTRLEELKANIRSIRREKETVMQEKQSVELRLKQLGVDHDALRKEVKARKARKNRPRSRGSGMSHLLRPKVQEELKGLFIKSAEELDDLETSLVELEHRKKQTKDKLRNSDAVREYLKNSTSRLVQKHEEMCQRSERLDNAISKMTKGGEQLRKMVGYVIDKNEHLRGQVDMFIDELNHGHMQSCAQKRAFHQNCVVLARYVDNNKELQSTNDSLTSKITETATSWEKDKKNLGGMREELRKTRAENDELRSERRRHERSLENYKELIRSYSRVASRSSEMKTINRELLSFVALVQKQKDVLLKKVTGLHDEINLIHAMYQKLKGFSGKQTRKISSVPILEVNEEISQKSLQVALQSLREKLQNKSQVIGTLKRHLDVERSEGDRLHENIVKLLSNDEPVSLQLCALKIYKKSKRSGFMNFRKKRVENEQMSESETGSLNEKQFSIVIQLILAKQELANEMKESLEMESRLSLLVKHGEEYTELLHQKCSGTAPIALSTECAVEETNRKEMAILFKEKRGLENEFAFSEAHEGLLEKQISLLKKQRKLCTKALRKYEEELEGFADQSIVQALIDILMTSANHDITKSDTCRGGNVGNINQTTVATENTQRIGSRMD